MTTRKVVPISREDAVRRLRKCSTAIGWKGDDPLPAPFAKFQKKGKGDTVYSRQISTEDTFKGKYTQHNLLVPPYDPSKLFAVYDSSSLLSPYIDAYVQNTAGFGSAFSYIGPPGQRDSKPAKQEKEQLLAFLRQVNELESLTTIRKTIRADIETTGNGFMEVTRYRTGEIACLYHMDAEYMRLRKLDAKEEPVEVTIELPRNGKMRMTTIRRRFRQFAQLIPGTAKVRFFKEFGDPRVLNPETGEFDDKLPPEEGASEVIHFKIGTKPYGVPRWIGNLLGILGVRNADYVNYDLLDSQGIPPLAILVAGGILTQESIETIEALLKEAKGYQNFHRILLLEAQAEGGFDDKTVPKVALEPLRAARAEDAMFQKYSEATDLKLRTDFRLPPLYLGRSQDYNRAVIVYSRIVAEEQVFQPIRAREDEQLNNTIIKEQKPKYWLLKSGGPSLVTGEGLIAGFDSFAKAGVLTINQGIEIANRAMGMDLQEIKEEWADYPLTVVNRLLDRGFFTDLGQLINMLEGTASAMVVPTALPAPEASVIEKVRHLLEGVRNKALKQMEKNEKEDISTGSATTIPKD